MRAVHESFWLVIGLYECEILDHVGMGVETWDGYIT